MTSVQGPSVFLEYEGKPVPARELTWAVYSPCGCQSGVIVAQSGTYLIPDEATAWKEYFETAAIRNREKKRGYSFRLLRHEDSTKNLGGNCPHTPKWGVPDTTPPEGMAWGKSSSGKTMHLIPFDGESSNRHSFVTAKDYKGRIVASCGKEDWGWDVDDFLLSELLTCSKCEAALTK
ncbi:hypothetical protein [Paenarthrobacter sp. JL.01a]|uniref:hypothetical protein n=1 Tax=Paenarthrobacter sp. JL.01a TaxID=2979324 RepID=UPI0021C8033D|nr:hypothetical protein [Paenarthrobacter sp. JL.01a]UXM92523.1 hypothetical protein N5P29_04135 [Paenarthrobacter sp. JL.01a]